MSGLHTSLLLFLAAIWGSSFLFLRIAVPPLGIWGAVIVTFIRLTLASVALVGFFSLRGMRFEFRKNWRVFLGIGMLNTSIPFSLFAASAHHLPAAVMVILNATVPLFGALLSWYWFRERFTPLRILGLGLGVAGVACVVSQAFGGAPSSAHPPSSIALGVAACLVASLCYAAASVMIKSYAAHLKPMVLAGGSQVFAALSLLPLLPFIALSPSAPVGFPHGAVIGAILSLALGSTALAYIFYFKLVADLGPTRAATVTFLMPLFGMLWGALFLQESITGMGVLGCGLILLGVRFVLGRR